jgi:hypothetical protein
VKDRLAGGGARIDDRAISCLVETRVIRKARGNAQEMAEHGFVSLRRFVERLDVFEWNHQHVRRRLRIDVLDRNRVFILMHKLSWDFAGDDFAEETVFIGHDCFSQPGTQTGFQISAQALDFDLRPDFKSQISILRSQTLDFRFEISDISDLKFEVEISDLNFELRFQISTLS